MELKIAEGKTKEEIIDFLWKHLPESIESISIDELDDAADLIYGARNNTIEINEYITIKIVMSITKETK
jgi:hypothetical protein